jgi:hypothetical protein
MRAYPLGVLSGTGGALWVPLFLILAGLGGVTLGALFCLVVLLPLVRALGADRWGVARPLSSAQLARYTAPPGRGSPDARPWLTLVQSRQRWRAA